MYSEIKADSFDSADLAEQTRINNLILKGRLEDKIENINEGTPRNHRNWNIGRELFINANYHNITSSEKQFLVENSKGKGAVLTQLNVQENSVSGIPLKETYGPFMAGDIVRLVKRHNGQMEYIGLNRVSSDLE